MRKSTLELAKKATKYMEKQFQQAEMSSNMSHTQQHPHQQQLYIPDGSFENGYSQPPPPNEFPPGAVPYRPSYDSPDPVPDPSHASSSSGSVFLPTNGAQSNGHAQGYAQFETPQPHRPNFAQGLGPGPESYAAHPAPSNEPPPGVDPYRPSYESYGPSHASSSSGSAFLPNGAQLDTHGYAQFGTSQPPPSNFAPGPGSYALAPPANHAPPQPPSSYLAQGPGSYALAPPANHVPPPSHVPPPDYVAPAKPVPPQPPSSNLAQGPGSYAPAPPANQVPPPDYVPPAKPAGTGYSAAPTGAPFSHHQYMSNGPSQQSAPPAFPSHHSSPATSFDTPFSSGNYPPQPPQQYASPAGPYASPSPGHAHPSFQASQHPFNPPLPPAQHVQPAAPAVRPYVAPFSKFSHAPHAPLAYPNPVPVPFPAPAQASHVAYVPSTPLLPPDTVPQGYARIASATVKLGSLAVKEARKGLSRVLQTESMDDLEHFAWQLQTADKAACELDHDKKDKIPAFALSYQQFDPPPGSRFKFGDGLHCRQWANFVVCMKEIAFCGIPQIRVWLDQCLWLRDASQGCWAHTGIVPYVLWPVISLGYKRPGAERTVLTERRMWPFMEEVAGLWSMGVLIIEEMRNMTDERSLRRSSSFNRREKLEPEKAMELLLLNVFHGACEKLETGWKKDVEELEDMALWNVFANTEEIFVGSDWKERVAGVDNRGFSDAIHNICLSVRQKYRDDTDRYIDASRKVQVETWNGGVEFLSGRSPGRAPDRHDLDRLALGMGKYNVIADGMELQLLKVGGYSGVLWLIVCMEGQSSGFSRGKVRWTKVVTGKIGCGLGHALEKENWLVLSNCLEEQIGEKVCIKQVRNMYRVPIEWV